MGIRGIVVAAGSGIRFGGNKHLVDLGGKAAWEHARDTLSAAGCEEVVVVGDVPGGIPGGARRRDSVAIGLDSIGVTAELVLVHDAARPAASVILAKAVLARLSRGDVEGVVPALAVTDTIKVVDGDLVTATPDRAALMAVQTPQGFRVEALRAAHQLDGEATDDAELIERWGGKVAVIEGEPSNLKITYPHDAELIRKHLSGS